jgi:CHASE2 domain-containing sensor protein
VLRLASQARITEQAVRAVHSPRTQRYRLVQMWRWSWLRLMLGSLVHTLPRSSVSLFFNVHVVLFSFPSSFAFTIGRLTGGLTETG